MIIDPLHGDGYQFWSGIGSDAFLVTAVAVFYRRHNCHVQRCWRLSWKAFDGHALCRKHHPHEPPTAAQVRSLK